MLMDRSWRKRCRPLLFRPALLIDDALIDSTGERLRNCVRVLSGGRRQWELHLACIGIVGVWIRVWRRGLPGFELCATSREDPEIVANDRANRRFMIDSFPLFIIRTRKHPAMHENFNLLVTLAAGLIGAVTLGYFAHRLGWSPIIGYLLAGILAGPHTPGFVADQHMADELAEVGVILLMFGVGLHFHLADLIAVRGVAIGGAICQSAVTTALGAAMARLFGWDWPAGIVFGLALSVASTVVLTRVLTDNDQLQTPTGRIAIGWLVVEDIFTVFVLVLLPVIFGGSTAATFSLPVLFTLAALKLALFIAFTMIPAGRFIPWILNKIAETHSHELFTLGVLAVALGVAVSAAYVFGVSMALGAFLAGMVVGQSEFGARAGAEALPMRDAFAVMFFLSVGMLLDPRQLIESPWLILATLAIVMIGKPLAAMIIVAVLGYSSRIAIGVAIALAQIGEFSFLLGTLGIQVGALPPAAMNPLVAVAIVSIMLNPVLYRSVDRVESFLIRQPRLWRLLNRRAERELAPQMNADQRR